MIFTWCVFIVYVLSCFLMKV